MLASEYSRVGRLVREGARTYTYDYHVDGQLARADYGKVGGNDGRARTPAAPPASSEDFLWDCLALIKRGDERFVNEPHVGGGNPVASSKGTTYFNDILGTTVGIREGRAPSRPKSPRYSAAALTAFGESIPASQPLNTSTSQQFFTGKPQVAGLGHAFLFRNYRAGLAKWQTADPLGYPNGWNQLAYCGNGVTDAVDLWGCAKFCTNGGGEFIWHAYKESIYIDYVDGIHPLEHPKVPAPTDANRVMDAIRSLSGMTVTFGDESEDYSDDWVFFKTYDECSSGNYMYRKDCYLLYKVTKTSRYAYYSKSSLLSSLGVGCTTVGAAASIVSVLFPEIAIPAELVGNGASLTGFLTWLGGTITGNDCKTLLFSEYNGEWKDKARIDFLHRRIE